MNFKNKGFSAIVSLSLLLILTVISVNSFQVWFSGYSQKTFNLVEEEDFSKKLQINGFHQNKLYLSNLKNKDINQILINSKECKNFRPGIQLNNTLEINVRGCISNEDLLKEKIEFSVITNQGVISKYDLIDNNYNLDVDCNSLKGGNWTKVPANLNYGLGSFCVMTYEAKWDGNGSIFDSVNKYCGNGNLNGQNNCTVNGSIGIVSKAQDSPLTKLNYYEARDLCRLMGNDFDLISDREWMVIAQNIANQSNNWANGVIGSEISSGGGLFRGNVGVLDSVSYDGANPESGTGRNLKARHQLSNGEFIWDFSGNVWEYTLIDEIKCDEGYPCENLPYDLTPASEWIEITTIDTFGIFENNFLEPFNNTWNSSNGIGKIYSSVSGAWHVSSGYLKNTSHITLRGGRSIDTNKAGVFSNWIGNNPFSLGANSGFRCSYNP